MSDSTQYFRVLRRFLWMLLAFPVVAGLTAGAVSYELPKEYEATSVVLVNPKQQVLPAAEAGLSTQLDQLVQTYAQLITNQPVYLKLISDGIPRTQQELKKEIKVTREPNTTLIDITVRDHDPQVALLAARDIVPAFNSSLDQIQSKVLSGAQAGTLDALVPWAIPQDAPTDPVSPIIWLNVIVALVAGLMIAVGLAFLLDYLDDTLRSEYDVRLRLDLQLLGTIFMRKREGRRGRSRESMALTALTHPKEPVSEAFKAVRTALMFSLSDKDRLRTLLVTSTIPGEGKTSTACNLAVAIAQAGQRVILVDADFRRPDLHRIFHRSENVGLGNWILGDRPEDTLIVATPEPNLRVVCSGPTPPNPSELLGSTRMRAVMERLKEMADVVILDTPPIAAVTDATVLATQVDGVVLVAEGNRTPVSSILKSRDILLSVNARILGVVLNKMRVTAADYYYYRYYGETQGSNGAPRRAAVMPVRDGEGERVAPLQVAHRDMPPQ